MLDTLGKALFLFSHSTKHLFHLKYLSVYDIVKCIEYITLVVVSEFFQYCRNIQRHINLLSDMKRDYYVVNFMTKI